MATAVRTWSDISSFHVEYAQATTLSTHRHDDHELVAPLSGTVTVVAPLGSWALAPGTAVWVPADTPHTVTISPQTVLRGIHLRPPLAEGRRWAHPHAFDIDPVLLALARRLETPDLPDAERGRTAAVVIDLLEESRVNGASLPVPRDQRALRVADAILADPTDARELRDWASALGVSSRTLARAFTADTALSFSAWRTRARVGASLSPLTAGGRVADVARGVGYTNVSAFIVAFRSEIGVTPGAYARTHRAG